MTAGTPKGTNPIIAWTDAVLRYLAGGGIGQARSEDLAYLRRDQAKGLMTTSWLFAVFGISSIGLIVADFRHVLGVQGVALCVMIVALYVAWLQVGRRWRTTQDDGAFLQRSVLLLFVAGTLWGVLVNLLGARGDRVDLVTVTAIIMALISTPMLGTPFAAAIAFWLPITSASSLAVAFELRPFDPAMMLLFAGYVGFTGVGMFMVNRILVERALGRIVLRRSQDTLDMFLDPSSATGWAWETDHGLALARITPQFANAMRTTAARLQGVSLAALLGRGGDAQGVNAPTLALLESGAGFRDQIVAIDLGCETRWWNMTGQPSADGAGFSGFRGVATDVTEKRLAEQRLHVLATQDCLTGIANRQSFNDRLDAACAAPGNTNRPGFAVILIDLDDFKRINDTYGHATGDEVLHAVGARLDETVRQHDLAARLGGDEFALLVAHAGQAEVDIIVERLRTRLAAPVMAADIALQIGASFGVALYPAHGSDRTELLHNADVALYDAKQHGRGCHRLFGAEPDACDPDVGDPSVGDPGAGDMLRRATLRLSFDATIDGATGRFLSAAPCPVWHDAERGELGHALLQTLAGDARLADALFEEVVARACTVASQWQSAIRLTLSPGPLPPDGTAMLDALETIPASAGLAMSRLELALPEAGWRRLGADGLARLRAMRRDGMRLLLDDVGATRLDLTLLGMYPIDAIRLDATLPGDLNHDRGVAGLIRLIAGMTRVMGVPMIAKGVDQAGQIAALRELGVAEMSGAAIAAMAEQVAAA